MFSNLKERFRRFYIRQTILKLASRHFQIAQQYDQEYKFYVALDAHDLITEKLREAYSYHATSCNSLLQLAQSYEKPAAKTVQESSQKTS